MSQLTHSRAQIHDPRVAESIYTVMDKDGNVKGSGMLTMKAGELYWDPPISPLRGGDVRRFELPKFEG